MEAFDFYLFNHWPVFNETFKIFLLLLHDRRKKGALKTSESKVKCLLYQIMKDSLWQKVKMVTFDKEQISSLTNLLKLSAVCIKSRKDLKNFESILVIL